MTEECGAELSDGGTCSFKPKYEDGRCGHHTETGENETQGRPNKLTYERQEKIASKIEQGRSINSAARMVGVTPITVHNWMERGEADKEAGKDNAYTDFFERLTRAKGYGEEWYMKSIIDLAENENEDHRFLASLMKQRYSDSWGDTETGVEADTVKLEVSERVASTWPDE